MDLSRSCLTVFLNSYGEPGLVIVTHCIYQLFPIDDTLLAACEPLLYNVLIQEVMVPEAVNRLVQQVSLYTCVLLSGKN